MKIGMQTWGSHGDIIPFIALALGLQKAGHDVTLAVTCGDNKNYSDLASRLGINLFHVHEKFEEVPQEVRREISTTRDSIKALKLTNRYYLDPALDELYEASTMLCADNDIVICHFWVHTMLTAATLQSRLRVVVSLCPLNVRSDYFPANGPNLGAWLNGLLWDLGDYMMKKQLFQEANRLRESEGLPPLKSILRELLISDDLTLVASSPSLCKKPPDWGDNIQISGFLNMPPTETQSGIPEELDQFLKAGEPPVYFTLGSCDKFFPEENAKLFLDTIELTGVRAVVQSCCPKTFESCNRNRIHVLNEIVNHDRIFPECKLIIHHGGAGTTQSALRAGKPSIAIEHGFDQGYWGKVLVNADVSPKLLHRRSVTPAKLAKAILKGIRSPQIQANAQKLGKLLMQEDGVQSAVEIIQRRFS